MFKTKLDNQNTYKLDSSNLYQSVVSFPDQIGVAWNEAKLVDLTNDQRVVKKIVVAGMGGSALGARIIKAWAMNKLKVPMEIVTDYHLPDFVDSGTWVILSSYSGTTEETLQAGEEAIMKDAKVTVLCTGGPLAQLALNQGWSSYVFEPSFNPGNMPRMAIGYNCVALLSLLVREDLLTVEDKQIEDMVTYLKLQQTTLVRERQESENAAKRLAQKLSGSGVLLIAARHLSGAVYAFKNQLNENAKTFAEFHEVPELNHHLLEGLTYPKALKNDLKVVLFESDLYESDIKKKMTLTEEVLTKQGYAVTRIKPEAPGELTQIFETIQFGEFVSFYTSMLNGLDPAPIVWVDYFKRRMKEM